jgi:hypothetical protein
MVLAALSKVARERVRLARSMKTVLESATIGHKSASVPILLVYSKWYLLNHPKNGVHFKLLFAVTLQYFGKMEPSIRTSISVWWLPTNTAGLISIASSLFMLPVKRNETPVVIHMLHLNARPVVHWLSPP